MTLEERVEEIRQIGLELYEVTNQLLLRQDAFAVWEERAARFGEGMSQAMVALEERLTALEKAHESLANDVSGYDP